MAEAMEASSGLATAKVILSATASFTATLLLARSVTRDLLPEDIQENFAWAVRKFCTRYFASKLTIVVEEFEGLEPNKLYEAASDYLATKISPSTTRIRVSRHEKEARHNVSVEPEQEITDVFDGVNIKWELALRRVQSNQPMMGRRYGFETSETRYFELTFHRKHKDTIVDRYLPYVEERAKEVRQEKKTLKLFTLSMDFYNLSDIWTPVNLDHPSTFDTLAMDSGLKETVLEDLERFVRRKEYYRRVGKAWKRGYLLFGPPGTGKSSLIAAMANYLKFDVYDLELSGVSENWELRKALVATANRSILVVEDIDCAIDFSDRSATKEETTEPSEPPQQKKITLSGLLNFIDGLWSSCGDERIIIFTTNNKEKLDPALLRPGRMDMHVHMSYCTPSGFRLLASNYLGVKHHFLFGEIEDLIRSTEVTPAEVAEELMKSDDPEKAFRDVIEFLRAKKEDKENEEEKVTKEEGSKKKEDEATEENKDIKIKKELAL